MSAVLCLLLLTPADAFIQRHGDTEAILTLSIPEESIGPGRARVRIDIAINGIEGVEVDGPRLEDAVAGWRAVRQSSSWRRDDGRECIDLGLTLEQVKPGVVPLPGVVVRTRRGASDWIEFTWPDLLHESRDVARPDALPDPPPSRWLDWLRWLAVALAAMLALAWIGRTAWRWRPTPKEQAAHVRALARLAGDGLSGAAHIGHIDGVVRAYLSERFGINAMRRTATEVLADCATLPDETHAALTDLFRRAELAKYAGATVTEEQRGEAVELARRIIERCATLPAAQARAEAENGKPGESR